ncbi:MAG: hypothetical protein KDE27_16180 [Planctomycetes bacterium]|nr:hypothetical protein [Planctomycetota bacterium]
MSQTLSSGRCASTAVAGPSTRPYTPLLAALLATAAANQVAAQCSSTWQVGDALPGTSDPVSALIRYDPDGVGPRPAVLLLGGGFEVAGGAIVHGLATWDPEARVFAPFGGVGNAGVDGEIRELVSLPNGGLLAAGAFTAIGGVAAANIARFDGVAWSGLGGGTDGPVNALAVLPNGDVVAGGDFQTAGGGAANRIARWDGASWTALGVGLDAAVLDLAVRRDGNVIAAGGFQPPLRGVAEWDGVGWSGFGAGLGSTATPVRAIAMLPNGDLLAAGHISVSSGLTGISSVVRWNGTAWSVVGDLGGNVHGLSFFPNGDLLAVGTFLSTLGNVLTVRVARWDGVRWSGFEDGVGGPFPPATVSRGVVWPDGRIFVAGEFTECSSAVPFRPYARTANLARWTDGRWAALCDGTGDEPRVLHFHAGDLIAGGTHVLNGVRALGVARHDGTRWQPTGEGMWGTVRTLATLPNGELIAGGIFRLPATAAFLRNLAVFDGTRWRRFPVPDPGDVYRLLVLQNGALAVVAGWANPAAGSVRIWNGTTFVPIAGAIGVQGLAERPNRELVAIGPMQTATSSLVHVAVSDGSTWTDIGRVYAPTFYPRVDDVAILPNGDVAIGGHFESIDGVAAANVARWDGAQWHPIGSGLPSWVRKLEVLANGQLVACETAAGGGFVRRWDGASWLPLGVGLDGGAYSSAIGPDGSLWLGGAFTTAGGNIAARIARWQPSCPASETALGSSCAAVDLELERLPWTGGVLEGRCTGIAPAALAAVLVGVSSPNTPLAALHPAGVAGCNLLASPDAVALLLPNGGGVARFALPVAAAGAFAGLPLNTQVLELQTGPLALTSSNAIRAIVGAY